MYINRFIFTGPPGSGKTTLLQHLAEHGFAIAAEAATDVISQEQTQGVAAPWTDPSFIDAITRLQEERRVAMGESRPIQLYDRSPICTVALANWLGHPIPDVLHRQIERLLQQRIYRTEVFLVESLGFVTPTEARRINLADSIRFGELHERTYAAYGFRLIRVSPAPVAQRAAAVLQELASLCPAVASPN
jgi:predicted ATPase